MATLRRIPPNAGPRVSVTTIESLADDTPVEIMAANQKRWGYKIMNIGDETAYILEGAGSLDPAGPFFSYFLDPGDIYESYEPAAPDSIKACAVDGSPTTLSIVEKSW